MQIDDAIFHIVTVANQMQFDLVAHFLTSDGHSSGQLGVLKRKLRVRCYHWN